MAKHRGGRGSGSGLGRTLIKEKKRERRSKKQTDGWLHTTELNDGYNWGRLNLSSVTEESSIDEFLRTAELAGTEFTAEKLNVQVVVPQRYTGLPTVEERKEIEQAQQENSSYLRIPRRPAWDKTTTTEQLELKERESFLEWRRSLAQLQENERLTLTPFERNLEFWRQLWRVIERSDVVVQIMDARNPLLFRCEDLERYVDEHHSGKKNMILMSKADLLTPHQRAAWANYFRATSRIEVAFWSSFTENNKQSGKTTEHYGNSQVTKATQHRGNGEVNTSGDNSRVEPEDREEGLPVSEKLSDDTSAGSSVIESEITISEKDEQHSIVSEKLSDDAREEIGSVKGSEVSVAMESDEEVAGKVISGYQGSKGEEALAGGDVSPDSLPGAGSGVTQGDCLPDLLHASRLLSVEELLALFRKLGEDKATPVTVGLVGYPNVGKSSTINTLLQQKKVPVSATPGRTKHFQTLYVSSDLLLCDCPGLVFPTFVCTKADLVSNGILSIDQMRDHVGPTALICQNVPRRVLEATYGICLPRPREGEDENRPPFADELLSAYAYMRGFMTRHGQPDQSRAARYILKDYVSGQKLRFCHPPPGIDAATFNTQLLVSSASERLDDDSGTLENVEKCYPKAMATPSSPFDRAYFWEARGQVHTKSTFRPATTEIGSKKHGKRNRKEKLRRIVGATPYN